MALKGQRCSENWNLTCLYGLDPCLVGGPLLGFSVPWKILLGSFPVDCSLCIAICNFCSSSGRCQHTDSSVVLSASGFHRNIHGSIPEPLDCSVSSLSLHRSSNFQSRKRKNRERKKGLVHWAVGSTGICILHPWKLICTQLTFIGSILVSQSGSKLLKDAYWKMIRKQSPDIFLRKENKEN